MKSVAVLHRTGMLWVIILMNWSVLSQGDTSCIATQGGDSGGANCVFPFLYNGITYSECTDERAYNAWCATTDNYDVDERWGYCIIPTYGGNASGADCQFPFKHQTGQTTVEYRSCVKNQGDIQTWCEVGDGERWGYCDMTCSGGATPTPKATPSTFISTKQKLVVGIVGVVVVIALIAVVVCYIIKKCRKNHRNAGERPTSRADNYYNVSPATKLRPHSTARQIPERNSDTASYEQIVLAGD